MEKNRNLKTATKSWCGDRMAHRQDSTALWILPWWCSSVPRIRGLLCSFEEDSNRLSPITEAVWHFHFLTVKSKLKACSDDTWLAVNV